MIRNELLKLLLINTNVLIANIFVGGIVFRKRGLNSQSPLVDRLFLGTVGGIVGWMLLLFGFSTFAPVILDFHFILIILIAICGGTVSVMITTTIMILFWFVSFGINYYTIGASFAAYLIALGCSYLSQLPLRKLYKWTIMFIYGFTVNLLAIYVSLRGHHGVFPILGYYVFSTSIIGAVSFYVLQLVQQYNKDYRFLKIENNKDFLTQLGNIRLFEHAFREASQDARNKNERLSILMIDIDFFKRVNDTYGHAAGNEVLRQLGRLLARTCRRFDIVARIGGEEFAVLLPDCPEEQAYEVGERVRKAIERFRFTISNGTILPVTVSLGIATYLDNVDIIEKLIERADNALYHAKNTGRNKCCLAIKCLEVENLL